MVQLTEEKMAHIKELRKKAMKLPLHPGVYIMHSRDDTIIYIGKAKALKNRVSQYFGSDKNHNEKVRRMVSNVEYFEYILTDSEFEALILESSLIKQHQPKYNILLKDDKGYSYIKVTAGDWPRISETKQVLNDGAKYIGPYLSAWTIKDTVEEARKIFRLPSCTRKFPQEIGRGRPGRGRPCLNYYIKQCCAPCRGHVSQKEYNEAVQEALDFIRGGTSDSVRTLTEKMNEAAENLDFELAARIRDRITAINKLKERQKVVASRVPEQDVIALVLGGEKVSIQVFRFAGGRLFDEKRSPFGVRLSPVQCIHYALTRPAVSAILCGYDTSSSLILKFYFWIEMRKLNSSVVSRKMPRNTFLCEISFLRPSRKNLVQVLNRWNTDIQKALNSKRGQLNFSHIQP